MRALEDLGRDMPLAGVVTVEKLGPPQAQFKIVKLTTGDRVIVDQDRYVQFCPAHDVYALAG